MKSVIPTIAALVGTSVALVPRSQPIAARDDCPADLQADFLFPHLIVPISAANPDTMYGDVLSPIITPNDLCTTFNFDVPASANGLYCTLEFYFPTQAELVTSSYTEQGPGDFTFTGYNPGSGVTDETTYNTQPPSTEFPPFPPLQLLPGNYYLIDDGPCVIINNASTVVSGKICSNDTLFTYFQDYNPCPIGIYVGIHAPPAS